APTLEDLTRALSPPRAVWAMIPAGPPVDELIDRLLPGLAPGDLVIDGGNSNYRESRRRAERLAAAGLQFVDAGTSGGIWGLELGYCLMVGGEKAAIEVLGPVLDALAPEGGWLHVGPRGAGHIARQVHTRTESGRLQSS